MLGAQDPHRFLIPDNRDTSETVEFFLSRFRSILEVRVACGLIEVEGFDIFGDIAGKSLTRKRFM